HQRREGFTTQSRVEGDMEAYGKRSQRVAMKLPRTRLVADSTARTAPRTGSFSTRQDPSSLGGPSRRLATETITTVASNARIAFTPTSSKTIAPSENASIARSAASAATRRSTVALDGPCAV